MKSLKKQSILFFIFCVLFLFSTTASADFTRNYTFGFGVHTGYMSGGGTLGTDQRAVYGVNARLRLFKFLGASVAYDFNPSRATTGEIAIPYPSLAVSGNIYLFNIKRVSFNLLGGVGFDVSNGLSLSSYHVGAGLDVQITKKFVISAAFRFLIPTSDAIQGRIEEEQRAIVEKQKQQAIQQMQQGEKTQSVVVDNPLSFDYIAGKVFDPNNFNVTIALRFYL